MDDDTLPVDDPEEKEEKGISSDLIRGHINTIILRALYDGDKYGYAIIAEIERKSHGQYTLKQPSLYSALKRLEKDGYVTSYWGGSVSGGRRKYFSLTEEGKEISETNQAEWEYSRTVIDSLISDKEFDFNNPAPTAVDMRMLRNSTSRVPSREGEDDELDYEPSLDDSAERERLTAEYEERSEEIERGRSALDEERARFEEEMRARNTAYKAECEWRERELAEREKKLEERRKEFESLRAESEQSAERQNALDVAESAAQKAEFEERMRLFEQEEAARRQALEEEETSRRLAMDAEEAARRQALEEEAVSRMQSIETEEAKRRQALDTEEIERKQALDAEEIERRQALERDEMLRKQALETELAQLRRDFETEEAERRAALEDEEISRRQILEDEETARREALEREETERRQALDEEETERRQALDEEETERRQALDEEEAERRITLEQELSSPLSEPDEEETEEAEALEEYSEEPAGETAAAEEIPEEEISEEEGSESDETEENELSERIAALEAEEAERRRMLEEEEAERRAALDAEETARRQALDEEEAARKQALEEETTALREEFESELARRRDLEAQTEEQLRSREQALVQKENYYLQEQARLGEMVRQRDEIIESERRTHREELEQIEQRVIEEQRALYSEREKELLHRNYRELINTPPAPASEPSDYTYYRQPVAEAPAEETEPQEDYRTVVRGIYASASPEPRPESYERARSLDGMDFDDIRSQAAQDGIRIMTAGGNRTPREESESMSIVHKGKALFLSALVVFCLCVIEGAVVWGLREQYAFPAVYPYLIWGTGLILLLVTGLAYANRFGERAIRRDNSMIWINAVVIYTLVAIVTLIVALGININFFTDPKMLATCVIVPIVFFFGIVVFGVCYYFLTRPKKQ